MTYLIKGIRQKIIFRFCPIIPMLLVNGAEGVGTGWATKILPRCPRQIVENTQRLIDGRPFKEMVRTMSIKI